MKPTTLTSALLAAGLLLAGPGCSDDPDPSGSPGSDAGADSAGPSDATGGDADAVGPGDTGGDSATLPDALADTTEPDATEPDVTGDVQAPDSADDTALPDAADPDAGQPDADTATTDATDTTDTTDTTDATDAGGSSEGSPYLGWASRVAIGEVYWDSMGALQSFVLAEFMDAPSLQWPAVVAQEGACTYYQAQAPGFCEPACDPFTEWCSTAGECVAHPERLSAGTVTLTGLAEPVTASPGASGWYEVTPAVLPADLFQPGAAVSVTAAGDAYPAFSGALTGVADMELGHDGEVQMVDGQDATIAWVPKGDGATVEVAIQIGWHGMPPTDVIFCTAAEDAGSVTLPASMVEAFPSAGGIGLFQHPSWIRRVTREVVETTAGPVEVRISSEQGLYPIHNAN